MVENSEALQVFLDCDFCDHSYVKNNLRYVDYVRDRMAAEVHVLATSQRTGAGGREYTFNFIGQGKFEGKDDVISVTLPPAVTNDERREARIKFLEIGLMPYVAQTPMIDFIAIDYTNENDSTRFEEVVDKWDYWVFRLGGNMWMNGQELYQSKDIGTHFSANRITEEWKFENWAQFNYNDNTYELDSVTSVFNFNQSYFVETSAVKSINDHWSAGLVASARSSTFSNIDFSARVSPAVEYNIFRYPDFTRKQIRLQYRVAFLEQQYVDTTIFNESRETLFQHRLSLSAEFVQKWGTINSSISASQYLHDPSLRNLSIWGSVSWRIVKGLNFDIGGNLDFIQDQIALPKGGASEIDILTQQQQLATQYSYWGRVGISYTFGSIYNNIVNPRFGN